MDGPPFWDVYSSVQYIKLLLGNHHIPTCLLPMAIVYYLIPIDFLFKIPDNLLATQI